MSRSVYVPAYAELVAYRDCSNIEDTDDFDFLVEDLQSAICALWPTVEPESRWYGREGSIIACNDFADFGISEYMGLLAIWVIPDDENPLAEQWVANIEPTFNKQFSELQLLGRASNGEAFFRRIEQ